LWADAVGSRIKEAHPFLVLFNEIYPAFAISITSSKKKQEGPLKLKIILDSA